MTLPLKSFVVSTLENSINHSILQHAIEKLTESKTVENENDLMKANLIFSSLEIAKTHQNVENSDFFFNIVTPIPEISHLDDVRNHELSKNAAKVWGCNETKSIADDFIV